jgi:hypothetical protein
MAHGVELVLTSQRNVRFLEYIPECSQSAGECAYTIPEEGPRWLVKSVVALGTPRFL